MIGHKEINDNMHYVKLVICVLLPLCLGAAAGLIASGGMEEYGTLTKPVLSPPAVVFPIAWTILYVMMGVASYLVITAFASSEYKMTALKLYGAQLIVNLTWSFLFFNLKEYLFAFVWLVLLWILAFLMMLAYRKVSWAAFYMTAPYIAWLTFAGYLNLGVYLLNR